MLTSDDVKQRLEAMSNNTAVVIAGVSVRRDEQGVWWIQAGGGVQFTRSAVRGSYLVRQLIKHLQECETTDNG